MTTFQATEEGSRTASQARMKEPQAPNEPSPSLPSDEVLRELLGKATPGPWFVRGHDMAGFHLMEVSDDDENVAIASGEVDPAPARDDAALIVAAVNALPALLDRAEAAERERDELKAQLTGHWNGTVGAHARAEAAIALRERAEARAESEIARLREALKPFALVAEKIRESATDERWLETPLFYMGDNDDPTKWSITGRGFDRARAAISFKDQDR